MDNTPKKLNKKLIISLIVLQILAIGYCLAHDNLKINSMDAQINGYTDNGAFIIYLNELDAGISIYNNEIMKNCSLFRGCSTRPMMRPEIKIKNTNDLIL